MAKKTKVMAQKTPQCDIEEHFNRSFDTTYEPIPSGVSVVRLDATPEDYERALRKAIAAQTRRDR